MSPRSREGLVELCALGSSCFTTTLDDDDKGLLSYNPFSPMVFTSSPSPPHPAAAHATKAATLLL